MHVALVTCRRLPDLDPDDHPLVAALVGRGHRATAAVWDDPGVDWTAFDVALLRSTWDYFQRRDEFLAWAERAASVTRLLNPLPLVRWNSHKGYLLELARRGATVVPTEIVPAGERFDVRARMAERGWARAVLKPAVSADAFGTVLVDASSLAAAQAHADTLLRDRDLMLQPYLRSVEEPGERCLVHIGGAYSHAVRKTSHFLGGRHVGPEGRPVDAAADELEAAARVLALAGAERALYARVDLARDDDGRPCLMELELVEPTLFFLTSARAAERMVDALETRVAARDAEAAAFSEPEPLLHVRGAKTRARTLDDDRAAEDAKMMIGRTVSRYAILERLGAGGMGEVYLAEDTRLHRRVALKMLREAHADGTARARLTREARLASALSHPGIAVIYEIDEIELEDGWRSFIAMEYVAGETLAEAARRERPDAARILDIAAQVADALSEAHARGVVHRDIKPSNVMLTEAGRVKVMDFGLAKYVPPALDSQTWSRGPADGFAEDGALVGTIAYMSPEQARGGEVDARSDVFSLGVVLYELLAGRPPFAGDNAIDLVDSLLHDDPPPPAELDDPAAGALWKLVRAMLAREPERRPQTMREVAREIEAIRAGGAGRGAPSLESAPAVAVVGFDNITKVPEDDWLGTGIAETVAADLRAVSGLTVIARERIHEAMRKLAATGPVDEQAVAARLGRELGARWVLGGGYQRMGDRVRVTARLTDVESGRLLRTVKIDGGMDEIFSVQDRIVAELSAGLRLTLAPGAREAEETQVIEAYEAFSRGMINLRAESHESVDRAILFFERAIALDPSYTQAHLKLGTAFDTKASYLVMPELHERAIAQFRRAIELRPTLVSAWREMGGVLVALGREEEGVDAIRHAIALDPGDAGAHAAMGRAYFIGFGDFARAAGCYEKALAFNPQAGWYVLQLAHCYALLRDFARGEDAARRAVTLQEDFQTGREGILIVGAHMRLGHLAALQGRHEEAIAHFHREIAFLERVEHALRNRILIELRQRLGSAHLRLGHEAQGHADLDLALEGFERRLHLGADEPFSRYYAACAYAVRGDVEPALAHLERAIRLRRRFTVARARIEPEFDGLRGERRFRELVGDAPL